jgi:hypothetical protein
MGDKKVYWFRPLKFWGVFAFFYPSSREGIIVTLVLSTVLIFLFCFIKDVTTTTFELLFWFTPWCIAFGAIYDMLCFRFGEYPSWWQKKNRI